MIKKPLLTYLLTYSFPCQDLSIAGKQKGMKKGSNTRSGLLWEVERLLNESNQLPDVLLMENVTQVHNENNIDDFISWCRFLESKGYTNHYEDLKGSNYEIPQVRDRCFMVSSLSGEYKFPVKHRLKSHLCDYLESDIEDDYFIDNKLLSQLIYEKTTNKDCLRIINNTDIGYLDAHLGDGIDLAFSKQNKRRGRVQHRKIQTLDTQGGNTKGVVVDKNGELTIRRLTPRECGRLMGVDDESISKILSIQSNRIAYKQFGNSIIVNVLYHIFKQMM